MGFDYFEKEKLRNVSGRVTFGSVVVGSTKLNLYGKLRNVSKSKKLKSVYRK